MSDTTTRVDRREWNVLQRRVEQMSARFKAIVGTAIVAVITAIFLWAPIAVSSPASPGDTAHDNIHHPESNTPAAAGESDADDVVQACYHRFLNAVWIYCRAGYYVAGIDYDNNEDGIGGVYCCPL